MRIITQNKFERQTVAPKQQNQKVLECLRKGSSSIIELLENVIDHAMQCGASDVHFDPAKKHMVVRFRVDGVLCDMYEVPDILQGELIARIKIVSGLRTDEHQSAHDGRFRLDLQGVPLDIRVSIAPTYYGENAVLRLLFQSGQQFTLEMLGFSGENAKKITACMQRPHGMILATGPTGSGKTTTLYTLVKMLNTRESSIVTVEDPIEYAIDGISQIQINPHFGLTFSSGLRAMLRQDPNVIMVGEIRDSETAALAINTALTGHLLLSTLHTNDAATTLPRLLDLKIEPYLIASTVNCIIGQRLLRKICSSCSIPNPVNVHDIELIAALLPKESLKSTAMLYKGKGCNACNFTGYSGRVGVHEVMVPDSDIREAVIKKASGEILKKMAEERGMIPMLRDAFEKVKAGITTLEEMLRMLQE